MEFIKTYAKVYNDGDNIEDDLVDDIQTVSNNSVDGSFIEQSVLDYHNSFPPLKNVTKSKEDAMRESIEFKVDCVNYDMDPENHLEQTTEEIEYDEFKNSDRKIDNFKEDFHIYEKNLLEFLYSVVLYGV